MGGAGRTEQGVAMNVKSSMKIATNGLYPKSRCSTTHSLGTQLNCDGIWINSFVEGAHYRKSRRKALLHTSELAQSYNALACRSLLATYSSIVLEQIRPANDDRGNRKRVSHTILQFADFAPGLPPALSARM